MVRISTVKNDNAAFTPLCISRELNSAMNILNVKAVWPLHHLQIKFNDNETYNLVEMLYSAAGLSCESGKDSHTRRDCTGAAGSWKSLGRKAEPWSGS